MSSGRWLQTLVLAIMLLAAGLGVIASPSVLRAEIDETSKICLFVSARVHRANFADVHDPLQEASQRLPKDALSARQLVQHLNKTVQSNLLPRLATEGRFAFDCVVGRHAAERMYAVTVVVDDVPRCPAECRYRLRYDRMWCGGRSCFSENAFHDELTVARVGKPLRDRELQHETNNVVRLLHRMISQRAWPASE